MFYQGASVPAEHSRQLHKLEPLSTQAGVTDLPGVAPLLQYHMDSPVCKPGFSAQRYPLGLQHYDIEGTRKAYEILAKVPPPFKDFSLILLEGYSVSAIQQVDERSTAYPDRENNLLIAPMILYPAPAPGSDAADTEEVAKTLGQSMVEALRGKHKLQAYVNYAAGFESQEALYGYDEWRLQKLRRLKREYDPENRFRFYAPITDL
jgi:hypothetical protein